MKIKILSSLWWAEMINKGGILERIFPRSCHIPSHEIQYLQHWKRRERVKYLSPIHVPNQITCHMGSHSVIYHPTQVNVPNLTASQPGNLRWTMDAWVDLSGRVHTEMFTCWQTVIHSSNNQCDFSCEIFFSFSFRFSYAPIFLLNRLSV